MMRTPAATVSPFLAVSALLLLLVASSVAANGYGGGDAPAGASGYGGHDDAPSGPKGDGGQDGGYQMPAYQKPVDGLDAGYYRKSCPDMEGIVQRAVKKALDADYTLAASLIRLFFHDFAVRGTDASVLIDVPHQSERYADASKTLRGFDLIEEIKTELEAKCHATVSCADILAAASRDAATAVGVPDWSLKYGRKDGKDSIAGEADRYVPMGGQSVTELIAFFESNGLSIIDLVVLSGAHTIGRATCGAVKPGLCDRRRAGAVERQYADFLQRKCVAGGDGEYVELDGETPTAFDSQYYKNLMRERGLLDTDQKMLPDSRTGGFVRAFANQPSQIFIHLFAQSMRKLGEVQVLTGNEGEVRRKCSAVNY
ncbi:Peroxidase 7 [Dichanthelium oligosanthes]|uniref:Peroxidase n=1 Tax=Dichanthelium oligosanthes TaxID=888268 RepID=A0A1E5VU57_9POAL|nr:Peroxidase 7 [Dichanthelium oligosanthes]